MANFEESFCDAEERAMRFLVADYGFRAVERTITLGQTMSMGGVVRYQSSGTGAARTPVRWSVTLSFAPLRLELSLDVSDGGKNQFSVEELNAVEQGTPIPGSAHSFYDSVHDAAAQYAEFARLASVLRASGSRFFAGDVALWADLQKQQRRWWQEDEDRRAIAASEQAFRSENWIEVVSLLEPRKIRLSGAAAARLAFAKKRLGDAA